MMRLYLTQFYPMSVVKFQPV
ncbi:hypothetical protein BCEP27_160011 [Burkholderia cepacia]